MSLTRVRTAETVWDFFFDAAYEEKSLVKDVFIAPAICICYYIIVTYIGPYLMKNRKPYNLKYIIIFYNLSLLIPNFYIVQGCLKATTGIFSETLCPPDSTKQFQKVRDAIRPYIWLFLLLKYVEFIDSIFFVMRKRFDLLTVLHRVHHASVPVIITAVLRNNASVCLYLAAAYNSFVHLFMYFYYALAACGPTFRKHLWWKKYLTALQIIQMMANITCVTVNAFTGCYPTLVSEVLLLCLSIFLLVMFINYFLHQFSKARAKILRTKED